MSPQGENPDLLFIALDGTTLSGLRAKLHLGAIRNKLGDIAGYKEEEE